MQISKWFIAKINSNFHFSFFNLQFRPARLLQNRKSHMLARS